MGFDNPAVIPVMSTCSILPNANTCPMELELPSEVSSFEDFCKQMDLAIISQATGFGVVWTACDNKVTKCALKGSYFFTRSVLMLAFQLLVEKMPAC